MNKALLLTTTAFVLLLSISLASAFNPYCYNSYHQDYPSAHIQFNNYYYPASYSSLHIQTDSPPSCYYGCGSYPMQYSTYYNTAYPPVNSGFVDYHFGIFRY